MEIAGKNIRYRRNVLGKVEAYDTDTGEIVGVEETENHWIAPPPGLSPVVYSPKLADLVIQAIEEGSTLTAALGQKGMPQLSTILRWCDKVPEFNERLERARRALSITLHDSVIEIAKTANTSVMSKADIESKKLAADLLKWGAEKNDQERYGSRKADQGPGNVQIIIQTGIDRSPVIEVKDERFKEGSGAGSGFGGQVVRGSREVAQEGGAREAGDKEPGANVDPGQEKQEE